MRKTRTKQCDRSHAVARLEHAGSFAALATLDPLSDHGPTRSAAVSNAVLAGIAASDVICCTVLGKRSASWDHRQALALLGSVPDIGPDAESRLRILLTVKDKAQYHEDDPSMAAAKRAIRAMNALIALAERCLG